MKERRQKKMDADEIKDQILKTSVNDHAYILKLAKQLKKISGQFTGTRVKIAVLASYSQQYFVMVLKLFLLKYDVDADILEGEYDGIRMAVLDKESKLYKFQPDIVILLSNYRDVREIPELMSSEQEIDRFVADQAAYYRELWERISAIQGCHIFQSNIVIPLEREIGNHEANVYYSKRTIYYLLNLELIKNRLRNVTIVDMEYIAALVGKENWFQYTSFYSSKIEYALKYIGIVCDVYAQQISVLQGKVKKCLVLDLDNTLWGGVVADEGPDGIRISPNDAIGEAYRAFQEYILKLKNRGVLLAVISKNDMETAKEPFEINKNMVLKYDDFVAFIANWNSKSSNIELVAKELNIGIDSLVFFDDNPAEREDIRIHYPEVEVIDVPENVADYIIALEKSHPFEWGSLTSEDIGRVDSYKENEERKKIYLQYKDYQEYLIALDMKGSVRCLEETDIERFTQLINKSNQFNVRTVRYQEAKIREMMYNDEYRLLAASLEDKFSVFGIISCVILKKEDRNCFIDTWVMSCRVLKRDMEKLVMNQIIKTAVQWGCNSIIGEYIPTEKNSMVKDLFEKLGFQFLERGGGGEKYIYDAMIGSIDNFVIKEMD